MSRWHNRGCVRDHIASEWSGEEEWSAKRKRCHGVEDNMDSVTFCACPCDTCGGPQIENGRRGQGVPDEEGTETLGTTAQMCGDSEVVEKGINGSCNVEQQFRGHLGGAKKLSSRGGRGTPPSGWKRLRMK